jgi:hypothetical protein
MRRCLVSTSANRAGEPAAAIETRIRTSSRVDAVLGDTEACAPTDIRDARSGAARPDRSSRA